MYVHPVLFLLFLLSVQIILNIGFAEEEKSLYFLMAITSVKNV